MPTVTKFIVALCPATPRYLHRDTADSFASEGYYATNDKSAARVFDTFDAAMEVCRIVKGWGGAQRVEEIAVEVEMPSLNDPATRIEARDIATAAFAEANETEIRLADAVDAAAEALRAEGYKVGVEVRNGAASFASLHLTDPFGVCLTLDWEPCAEGFDYATSGDDACDLGEEAAQHEPEPDDDGTPCDGCDSTEGEDAGDGFAFCAECRAKDAAAPRSEDENPDDDCDSADLADFVQGYLEGLFWTSMPSPEDDRTLEALGHRIDQLAPACRSAHEGHCRDFLVANKAALDEAILAYGATTTPSQVGYRERYTLRMAGLDFWLSRNGHGAGFFDRGREGY